MSDHSDITDVVKSYIQALYDWEAKAIGFSGDGHEPKSNLALSAQAMADRMKEMSESGELEFIESAYQRILKEYCTPRIRDGGFHFGSPVNHHPDHEHITKVQRVDETHALVWTHYQPPTSYPRVRRYHLELAHGAWLIHQHYLLDDEHEDFPEI